MNTLETDALLNTALEVDSGTIVVNKKGIITFANKAFAGVFNLNPDEMVGKHVFDAYVNSLPSRLPLVIDKGKPEFGHIHVLNGRNVVANRVPIYENSKIIGALGKVVFKDLEEFKSIYSKINIGKTLLNGSSTKYDINSIIGTSPKITRLKECIRKIAPLNSTILIRGECGTGKELLAQAIHNASFRQQNSFIQVNCAAIPEHLLESELFGYEDGAFTGARKGGKKGKFVLAHKGTIFLDEIGDMSFNMQAKLLRVLQEKEIEPLGSCQTESIDVRIIAATNANLEELLKSGKFREDLYYRLNVVSITAPPLRERKEDIPLLVDHFTQRFNETFSLNVETVSMEVLNFFKEYYWPGNVRELRNIMEQAFNFVEGNVISLEDISKNPSHFSLIAKKINVEEQSVISGRSKSAAHKEVELDLNESNSPERSLETFVDNAEKQMISRVLAECKGNKAKAAQILGLSRPGLYKKLAKYLI